MHSRDRRWPIVYWILAIMLLLIAVDIGVLHALTDFTLQQMLTEVDWASIDTFANVFLIIAMATLLWKITRYGIQARRRELLRKRALAGDERAMPEAAQSGEAADTVGIEPFTLRWPNGSTVTATASELVWRRRRKRDVSLAWDEARLLEAWEHHHFAPRKKDEIVQHGYCLYGSKKKYIEWTDEPEGQTAGESLSWKQKEQLQQKLLATIIGHTGLPVREIATAKTSEKATSRRRFAFQVSFMGSAFALLLAAFPVATGILALTAPLTTSFALNLYAAVVTGGVGLALLGVILKGVYNIFRPAIPKPPPPFVDLPPMIGVEANDAPYTIKFGSPRLRNRFMALAMVIFSLVSSIYLVIRATRDFAITNVKQGTFTDAHKLGLGMFMTCAFVGITFFAAPLFARSTTLLADQIGLHWGKGRKEQFIFWQDVVQVVAKVSAPNHLKLVEVIEAPPKGRTIDWSGDAQWLQPPEGVPAENAGAQFAAIVAERAGVQPVTRLA